MEKSKPISTNYHLKNVVTNFINTTCLEFYAGQLLFSSNSPNRIKIAEKLCIDLTQIFKILEIYDINPYQFIDISMTMLKDDLLEIDINKSVSLISKAGHLFTAFKNDEIVKILSHAASQQIGKMQTGSLIKVLVIFSRSRLPLMEPLIVKLVNKLMENSLDNLPIISIASIINSISRTQYHDNKIYDTLTNILISRMKAINHDIISFTIELDAIRRTVEKLMLMNYNNEKNFKIIYEILSAKYEETKKANKITSDDEDNFKLALEYCKKGFNKDTMIELLKSI